MERLTQISKQLRGDNTKDFFDNLPKDAEIDDNLRVGIEYRKDTSKNKMYLNHSFRLDSGELHEFKSVYLAERLVLQDQTLDKEYTSFEGVPEYIEESEKLIFGAKSPLLSLNKESRYYNFRHKSLCRDLVYETLGRTIAMAMPTYGNHPALLKRLEIVTYPYLDSNEKFNLKGTLEVIAKLKPKDSLLIHACAHNPTGIDPSESEWREIAGAIKKAGVVPFIDLAFQGLATGSLEKDRFVIDLFAQYGLNMLIAQTYSKNMGVYGQRIGVLSVVCSSSQSADKVRGVLKEIADAMYLTPHLFPARVIARVLGTPKLREMWEKELKEDIYDRLEHVRQTLYKLLSQKAPKKDWSSILKQVGVSCLLPLTSIITGHVTNSKNELGNQVEELIHEKHIYLLLNGRITLGSLNSKNMEYVTSNIADIVNKSQN